MTVLLRLSGASLPICPIEGDAAEVVWPLQMRCADRESHASHPHPARAPRTRRALAREAELKNQLAQALKKVCRWCLPAPQLWKSLAACATR